MRLLGFPLRFPPGFIYSSEVQLSGNACSHVADAFWGAVSRVIHSLYHYVWI